MVEYTEQRPGRSGALLYGIQSAKTVIVDDFTAPDTGVVWSSRFGVPGAQEFNEAPEWHMSKADAPSQDFDTKEGPKDVVQSQMTPDLVDKFLRNAWGPAVAGVFSRASQVNEFLTLAWVEDRFDPGVSTERLIRISDVLIHRLAFEIESNGEAEMVGDYAGRSSPLEVKLNALGGVTLPAAPMEPSDKNLFTGRSALLTRDPAGVAEAVAFDKLTVVIDRLLSEDYHMSEGSSDVAYGSVLVTLILEAQAAEESWNITDKTQAEASEDYRLVLTAPSPASTLTFDFHDVLFRSGIFGHDGREYLPYVATGFPKLDSSDDFLDIVLS